MSARARPTRLRMPPESSAGNFARTLSSSSRIFSFSTTLLADLALRELRVLDEREGDVVEHVDRVEERRVLVDHPELLADAVELALAHRDDVLAVDEDAAARRLLERHDQAEERRLAGAGAADDARRLAAPADEVDPAEDLGVAEGLAHSLEDDDVVARRTRRATGRPRPGRREDAREEEPGRAIAGASLAAAAWQGQPAGSTDGELRGSDSCPMTGEHLDAILKVAGAKSEKDGWHALPEGSAMTLHVAHDGASMTVSRIDARQARRRARLRAQPAARALRHRPQRRLRRGARGRGDRGQGRRRAGFG